MKIRVAFLLFFLAATPFAHAQTALAAQIFNLANEARTNPKAFLKAHRTELEKISTPYIAVLEKAQPMPKMAWDEGLVTMAKSKVENNNLNPDYKGKNTLCGMSSGSNSGSLSKNALSYVCDVFNNVHDEDNLFFGAYANKTLTGYSFVFGATCLTKKVEYAYDKKVDTSAVNFAKLNTAKNEKYMTEVEAKMIAEINFVRAYPKVYATIILHYLSEKSKSSFGLDKKEYDAGMELVAELNAMEPMPILTPKECVYNAAKKHGKDCEKRGFFAHEGSDGSQPWDRITAQCPDLGMGNENGVGSSNTGVREGVIALLIDQGISTRGHRHNMLNKNWKYVGCYRYVDKVYGFHWVQNFL